MYSRGLIGWCLSALNLSLLVSVQAILGLLFNSKQMKCGAQGRILKHFLFSPFCFPHLWLLSATNWLTTQFGCLNFHRSNSLLKSFWGIHVGVMIRNCNLPEALCLAQLPLFVLSAFPLRFFGGDSVEFKLRTLAIKISWIKAGGNSRRTKLRILEIFVFTTSNY